jgi:hypothetical protein
MGFTFMHQAAMHQAAIRIRILIRRFAPPSPGGKGKPDRSRVLGHEKEFGSISAGKSADLVAVAGDPLTDIRTLEHVKAVITRGDKICGGAGAKCRDASPP